MTLMYTIQYPLLNVTERYAVRLLAGYSELARIRRDVAELTSVVRSAPAHSGSATCRGRGLRGCTTGSDSQGVAYVDGRVDRV